MLGPRTFAPLVLALLSAAAGCTGAGLGESCSTSSDCKSSLQCFASICTQQCDTPFECGDGHLCNEGECQAVESAIGDACQRELDCAPGQACRLDESDTDGDGRLAASCQADQPGSGAAAECQFDSDCRNGSCAIGHCTQLCQVDADCPSALACVTMPRVEAARAPLFDGCLQAEGVLVHEINTSQPVQEISVAVPSNARSFAMVSTVGGGQFVGASRLVSPAGETLYATPTSPEEFFQNPIRHEPAPSVSTLLVPNNPAIELETGVYDVEVASFLPEGGIGTEAPRVKIFYKLTDSAVLDLHFHFADLSDHPCESAIGGVLNASTAPASSQFQNLYLPAIRQIFDEADIEIGTITYRDLDRPDLDSISAEKLPALLTRAAGETGVNIFFVRNIDPVGVQALAGGNPSPPLLPESSASGIAIGIDTMCYRSWTTLARISAHSMGQSMGLYRNREPDGEEDPILDTGGDTTNLMFFGEFGGTALSPGQKQVLRAWPGLR